MRIFKYLLLLIAILLVIQGCGSPAAVGLPVVRSPRSLANANPSQAPVYQVPGNATATPTPFLPLPPTAVYIPPNVPIPTATPLPTPMPTVVYQGESGVQQPELIQPPGQINILILGADARPGAKQFRTDTIVLATLNTEKGTVNLTSFPRDLFITIPGQGENRINTAYFFGRIPLLAETFKYNFGIRPDHYVLVKFSSFKDIIDSLGGLDVQVEEPLNDYRAGYQVHIPKGSVHMDADTVLWYVRSRKTTNDFARNRRQQEILKAIFNKLLSLDGLKRAPELYNYYKETVMTDLSLYDVISLIPLASKLTDDSRIHNYYVGPGQVDNWITPAGAMVLLPRMDAIRNIIRKSQNLK